MYTHTLLLRLGVYEFGRSFLGCLVRLKDLGCLGGHGGGGSTARSTAGCTFGDVWGGMF